MLNPKDIKLYLKEHLEFIRKYPNNVGSKIYEFENFFKYKFNSKYASACSNGSSGLLLSLKAIGIKKGDEVMLNCNYFISDPNSIILSGAKPIFIDLGKTISSLSLRDIKNKKTNKTKAIIIIHLNGYPIENTIEIKKYCKKENIKVIEDCCQSIGAKIGNKEIGTFGDLSVFSFDTNKIVKGGEGGMIISNNKKIINKVNLYKNNCKDNGEYIDLGFNFRYNDFSALYAKYSLNNINTYLEKIKKRIKQVEKNYKIYKPKGVSPIYYNIISEKSNNTKLISNDFLKINLNNFPNYKKFYSKYDIIELKNIH